jgi:hypothetical protein
MKMHSSAFTISNKISHLPAKYGGDVSTLAIERPLPCTAGSLSRPVAFGRAGAISHIQKNG